MTTPIKLISLYKALLQEGGNVFGNTGPISKADIEPTLERLVEELSRIFPKKKKTFSSLEKLGSAGRVDKSGDIDLSYDAEHLMPGGNPDLEGWGFSKEAFNTEYQNIRKKARTASEKESQLRAMLNLLGKRILESSKLLDVDLKGTAHGAVFLAIPQYDSKGNRQDTGVQVDINVGNPKWLRFSYYSQSYKDNVKGLHRTQLLVALFKNKGKTFRHDRGVFDIQTREVEATTPEECLELLKKYYGKGLTQDILDDYFKLMAFLKKNASREELSRVFDIYLKILDSTRADIPKDLQQYWIDNQDRLGLKGKFLPDTSELTKYKTA